MILCQAEESPKLNLRFTLISKRSFFWLKTEFSWGTTLLAFSPASLSPMISFKSEKFCRHVAHGRISLRLIVWVLVAGRLSWPKKRGNLKLVVSSPIMLYILSVVDRIRPHLLLKCSICEACDRYRRKLLSLWTSNRSMQFCPFCCCVKVTERHFDGLFFWRGGRVLGKGNQWRLRLPRDVVSYRASGVTPQIRPPSAASQICHKPAQSLRLFMSLWRGRGSCGIRCTPHGS